MAEAHASLQAEIQQLKQSQRSAGAALQASQLAQQQVNALGVALSAAQGTAFHSQQAADEAQAELGSQESMVGAAKQRLSTLSQQLHAAQIDFQATQNAAQNADASAHLAQSNAAEAGAAATTFSHGGYGGHSFSGGLGSYH